MNGWMLRGRLFDTQGSMEALVLHPSTCGDQKKEALSLKKGAVAYTLYRGAGMCLTTATVFVSYVCFLRFAFDRRVSACACSCASCRRAMRLVGNPTEREKVAVWPADDVERRTSEHSTVGPSYVADELRSWEYEKSTRICREFCAVVEVRNARDTRSLHLVRRT